MNLLDHLGIESGVDDLLAVLVLLDHAVEDGVNDLVVRQQVAVLLVGTKLRRRLLVDDSLGNDIAQRRIDVARKVVYLALV